MIYLVDMACPIEANIEQKRLEKIRKYQQLAYEIHERRQGYRVKVIPAVIGSLGGGIKTLRKDVSALFKEQLRAVEI